MISAQRKGRSTASLFLFTIFGITGTVSEGVDTSDATATASTIRSGYTAYVNGQKITGTVPAQASTTITPGTSQKTAVASGRITTGNVYVAGDSNLVASNIKSGVSIFGVTGTAQTLGTSTVAIYNKDNTGTDAYAWAYNQLIGTIASFKSFTMNVPGLLAVEVYSNGYSISGSATLLESSVYYRRNSSDRVYVYFFNVTGVAQIRVGYDA